MFDEGLFLWQAGSGEGGDGIPATGERTVRVQDTAVAHVRVHDQLHPQAQAFAREVHDEQRVGELYHSAGKWFIVDSLMATWCTKVSLRSEAWVMAFGQFCVFI